MLKIAPEQARTELEKLMPEGCKHDDPKQFLPTTLPYQGYLETFSDVIPCNELLQCLRSWMLRHDQGKVFYFLTESCEGDITDFSVDRDQLNHETLCQINPFFENIITAQDYSWVLFIDNEGEMHVAGSEEFFCNLRNSWDQLC
jgi:hypothetical protein